MEKMKQKLSGWFPEDVKPARNGIYQRDFFGFIYYCKWKNGKWFFGSCNYQKAKESRDVNSVLVPWRGIVK